MFGLRRAAAATLATLLLLGAVACSGDDGGDGGEADAETSSAPSAEATVAEESEEPAAPPSTSGVNPDVCDVLTEELAVSVDPTIDRQGFAGPDQCAWSGRRSGTVLLLTRASLEQAGAADEDAFFDAVAAQFGGELEEVEIGERGAILRPPDGELIDVAWTGDGTSYWTLLATYENGDDDAKADAMVEVARAIVEATTVDQG